jgi:hypothetical protein
MSARPIVPGSAARAAGALFTLTTLAMAWWLCWLVAVAHLSAGMLFVAFVASRAIPSR